MVDRSLQPLRRRQGTGLGELVICQDQGVEGRSRRKARLRAEKGRSGGGAQVPGLWHSQKIRLPPVQHPAGLGGAEGAGHRVEHAQTVAAGHIRPQGYLHALPEHDVDRGGAGAEILVGGGTVDGHHAVLRHGGTLPRIGPDTVGHQGTVIP